MRTKNNSRRVLNLRLGGSSAPFFLPLWTEMGHRTAVCRSPSGLECLSPVYIGRRQCYPSAIFVIVGVSGSVVSTG